MGLVRRTLLGAGIAAAAPALGRAQDPYAGVRAGMVGNIRQLVAAGALRGISRIDAKVLAVMGEVPRHLFVPEMIMGRAYGDHALEIGHGATISQPLIVAAMTDLARVRPTDVVLEVGTGSGYQAAVLSKLVRQVYSIELVAPLARSAADRLARLGYRNVEVRAGDGYKGWPERAPFDAIVVTAGAREVPPALIAQLKRGGRMVIPVGSQDQQQLLVLEKDARGRVSRRNHGAVTFVPLVEGR